MRSQINIGLVIALSWLFSAIGITIIIGPMLGARGWSWLIIHHILCLIGVGHEWRRQRKRSQASRTGTP